MAITGTKLFNTGDVLTASDTNQYLMRGVKVFADAATRDAAYGGAGEPTLEEGETCYLSDSNGVFVYTGSAWSNASGISFLKSQTISNNVSSVIVTSAFSALYKDYLVIVRDAYLVSSGTQAISVQLRTGSTTNTAGYYSGGFTNSYAGTNNVSFNSNTTSWSPIGGVSAVQSGHVFLYLHNPFVTRQTSFYMNYSYSASTGFVGGYHDSTTSFDQLVLSTTSVNFAGGVINIYGIEGA